MLRTSPLVDKTKCVVGSNRQAVGQEHPLTVLHLRGPRAGGPLERMAEPLKFDSFPLQPDSNGVIRVRGTRVTLDTVWAALQEGATAEEIVQQYPSLSLADAYQAIGYCLRNPAVLNAYLAKRSEAAEEIRN